MAKGPTTEGIGLGIMCFAIYAAYALAFFYGGVLVTQGRVDSGTVITVFMSTIIVSFSMAMLCQGATFLRLCFQRSPRCRDEMV
ncbi:hypothetical protein L198_04328 [Cryptococcus wingfieldii CBS 7118]|uniref:ABC transmembrane type-1 domain-containing protein n=1 Tax=Cryptococcus wingfieldii CBS 7118 TaxID=1295528 RepID=A0A1E3J4B1_9TREE|nr:hypothetical protein L198_04328 [Cryptococcus wingfieldii CBS 7118]ODN95710.1 hypothetical protein L198_04328 [Cryptococcus wingfieldii CBS 7118]